MPNPGGRIVRPSIPQLRVSKLGMLVALCLTLFVVTVGVIWFVIRVEVRANHLMVLVNKTGQTVDESISIPNPDFDPTQPVSDSNLQDILVNVVFNSADQVEAMIGNALIEASSEITGNGFRLSGDFAITKSTTLLTVDVTNVAFALL